MGIYDAQIAQTRKQIESCNEKIRNLEDDIAELEETALKCDKISSKISETMGTIFKGIDEYGSSINGNFALYFKRNIDQIAKNNNLYGISGKTASDKSQIEGKITSFEEQIRQLKSKVNSLEAELAYYKANNVEEGTEEN